MAPKAQPETEFQHDLETFRIPGQLSDCDLETSTSKLMAPLQKSDDLQSEAEKAESAADAATGKESTGDATSRMTESERPALRVNGDNIIDAWASI
ncbi:hypothetical protein KC345_g1257 [Hortaea werneckii]|nr:hypothetical protein KC345_g1257 [Hortaea werneckii]